MEKKRTAKKELESYHGGHKRKSSKSSNIHSFAEYGHEHMLLQELQEERANIMKLTIQEATTF
jgi:hypothetical protein